MNIEGIKEMIRNSVAMERSSHGLAKLIIKSSKVSGQPLDKKEANVICEIVINYIEHVPMFMEEGMNHARDLGLTEEMNQMMGELEYYWFQEEDLIPDYLGLIGITDDAYASMYLLQALSDYCSEVFDRPLMAADYTDANFFIRNIIGDEISSLLEQKVANTINSSFDNAITNQMYSNIFNSNFQFSDTKDNYISQFTHDIGINYQFGATGVMS